MGTTCKWILLFAALTTVVAHSGQDLAHSGQDLATDLLQSHEVPDKDGDDAAWFWNTMQDEDIRQELVHKLSKKSSVADVQEASAVTDSLAKPTDMGSGISDVADGTEVDSSHHNTVQSGPHAAVKKSPLRCYEFRSFFKSEAGKASMSNSKCTSSAHKTGTYSCVRECQLGEKCYTLLEERGYGSGGEKGGGSSNYGKQEGGCTSTCNAGKACCVADKCISSSKLSLGLLGVLTVAISL